MLGGDIFVFQCRSLNLGFCQNLRQRRREINLRRLSVNLRRFVDSFLDIGGQLGGIALYPLNNRWNNSVFLPQQRQQQMLAFNLRMVVFLRQPHSFVQRFLCFYRKFIVVHIFNSP